MAERHNRSSLLRAARGNPGVADLGERSVSNGGGAQLPEWLAIDWRCYERANRLSNDEYERQR